MIREWTPEAWANYCLANPARKAKTQRDCRLIDELLAQIPGQKILEAGCGYGRLTPLLQEASPLAVMDAELGMVQAVCKAIPKVRWGFVADIERLPLHSKTFDAVLCVGVLMHVRNPLRAIEQIAEAVKPEGKLLISWNNLCSPWSVLLGAWSIRPGALRQRFLGRGAILKLLHRLGFTVRQVRGDALLPLAAAIPGTKRSLWPSWLWKWAIRLEQWPGGHRLLGHLGYELFALAERGREQPF